jgi:hypothetical protein
VFDDRSLGLLNFSCLITVQLRVFLLFYVLHLPIVILLLIFVILIGLLIVCCCSLNTSAFCSGNGRIHPPTRFGCGSRGTVEREQGWLCGRAF